MRRWWKRNPIQKPRSADTATVLLMGRGIAYSLRKVLASCFFFQLSTALFHGSCVSGAFLLGSCHLSARHFQISAYYVQGVIVSF